MAGRTKKVTLSIDEKNLDWAGKNFKVLGFKSTSQLISAAVGRMRDGPPSERVYSLDEIIAALQKTLEQAKERKKMGPGDKNFNSESYFIRAALESLNPSMGEREREAIVNTKLYLMHLARKEGSRTEE